MVLRHRKAPANRGHVLDRRFALFRRLFQRGKARFKIGHARFKPPCPASLIHGFKAESFQIAYAAAAVSTLKYIHLFEIIYFFIMKHESKNSILTHM